MKIELHPDFKKSYKNRISSNPKLIAKTTNRINLFKKNPQNSILKDHSLKGSKKNIRSFSVTGDIRIIYIKVSKDHFLLLDIDTHNQVY
ncbi:MAG: hypothetical protein A2860_01060 [Candidatus Levybacteria bacterium RIFCSPHIGHO2_01_FULL_37_33]|nr:MAG: hypothetical protein A2860_01060 [Candidatus Levybacteria bacterium RIFCSPHIGHO2_01_FULL_37_33]OGH32526.1 MAG: hypothetical protein A2953_02615 [Candidatus Levybacteria bacterium RIFCSPLOWO2_01_FULL_36_54]